MNSIQNVQNLAVKRTNFVRRKTHFPLTNHECNCLIIKRNYNRVEIMVHIIIFRQLYTPHLYSAHKPHRISAPGFIRQMVASKSNGCVRRGYCNEIELWMPAWGKRGPRVPFAFSAPLRLVQIMQLLAAYLSLGVKCNPYSLLIITAK